MMEDLEFALLDVLHAIREDKEARGIVPAYAITLELRDAMGDVNREAIRLAAVRLQKKGIIRRGRTLNHTYYELTDNQNI